MPRDESEKFFFQEVFLKLNDLKVTNSDIIQLQTYYSQLSDTQKEEVKKDFLEGKTSEKYPPILNTVIQTKAIIRSNYAELTNEANKKYKEEKDAKKEKRKAERLAKGIDEPEESMPESSYDPDFQLNYMVDNLTKLAKENFNNLIKQTNKQYEDTLELISQAYAAIEMGGGEDSLLLVTFNFGLAVTNSQNLNDEDILPKITINEIDSLIKSMGKIALSLHDNPVSKEYLRDYQRTLATFVEMKEVIKSKTKINTKKEKTPSTDDKDKSARSDKGETPETETKTSSSSMETGKDSSHKPEAGAPEDYKDMIDPLKNRTSQLERELQVFVEMKKLNENLRNKEKKYSSTYRNSSNALLRILENQKMSISNYDSTDEVIANRAYLRLDFLQLANALSEFTANANTDESKRVSNLTTHLFSLYISKLSQPAFVTDKIYTSSVKQIKDILVALNTYHIALEGADPTSDIYKKRKQLFDAKCKELNLADDTPESVDKFIKTVTAAKDAIDSLKELKDVNKDANKDVTKVYKEGHELCYKLMKASKGNDLEFLASSVKATTAVVKAPEESNINALADKAIEGNKKHGFKRFVLGIACVIVGSLAVIAGLAGISVSIAATIVTLPTGIGPILSAGGLYGSIGLTAVGAGLIGAGAKGITMFNTSPTERAIANTQEKIAADAKLKKASK